jgi:hypothetical protein
MIPRNAAMSPFGRTGSQRSVIGVPTSKSILNGNFSRSRNPYSWGLGFTTCISPGSGIGLSATMVAPFCFARSRTVNMRG